MRNDQGDPSGNEVAVLNTQIESLDDPRECYRLVQERIQKHHEDGRRVPEDLAQLERQLMCECMAESQGR